MKKPLTANSELEPEAEFEIQRIQRIGPNSSKEEVINEMAKDLVTLREKNDRKEDFYGALLGSAAIGSVFLGIYSLFTGEWKNLFIAIIVLVISVIILKYIHK